MVDEVIRRIELAQDRLRDAQARAREIMSRQQARLELNRQAIGRTAEPTSPEGASAGP